MIFTAVIFRAQSFKAVTVNSVTHRTFVLFSRMTGMTWCFYADLIDADRSVLLFRVYSSQELQQRFNAHCSTALIKVKGKPVMIFLTTVPSEWKPQEVS